ncbi:MAG: GNAT family N-acetyltransferase [Kofleriaceae bacterium]|nr:GNAT family N-acetyltransferase [Kofleriaceae bacterium]
MTTLLCVTWRPPGDPAVFQAREPTDAEIATHAAALAQAYNDPHNAPLMGNTEAMSSIDVVSHYTTMNVAGARQFHLLVNNSLVGDADLRNFDPLAQTCEFAFMIAQRATQGRGWGTRFALMIHHLAFSRLSIERIYVAIVPANQASLRVFEKLGYRLDASVAARASADDASDITMAIDRADFLAAHRLQAIEITPR